MNWLHALRLNSNKIKLFENNGNGWYSKNSFWEILNKERHRSERTRLPMSFILIDFSDHKYNSEIHLIMYPNFIRKLIVYLSNNSRHYDIKYFCHPYRIEILLLDTPLNVAKLYIEKIMKKLFNFAVSKRLIEYIYLIEHANISAYPINHISISDIFQTRPVVHECLANNGNGSNQENASLQVRCDISMRWRHRISSDSNAPLTLPALCRSINDYPSQWAYMLIKRFIDIIGSAIGIALFSPLMLLISIAIKVTSSGPILFNQERLGYLGKPFRFLKFRTMDIDGDDQVHKDYMTKLITGNNNEVNANTKVEPVFKLIDDPRITKLGRLLRKTSLDELPQFFNVLFGQMSLVGPRPPIPYEVELYQDWHLRRILEVQPGITGLWQVSGRNETTFDEMVRLDLQYVKNQSIFLDIKILLKTFKAVFNTKAAY